MDDTNAKLMTEENDENVGVEYKNQDLLERLNELRRLTKIACTDGNWNYAPYLHGFANGMIFALAIMEDKNPVFLDAPGKWLKDRRDDVLEEQKETEV